MSRLLSRGKAAPNRRTTDVPVGAEPSSDVAASRVLSEFERLLREPGCPACRYIGEAERSFFSWFEIESFSTVEVQAQLGAGMGMCPRHSRRLIEAISEGHIMTTVTREALSGARTAILEEGEVGSCPACDAFAFASERARHVLLEGLLDPFTARLYFEHDGMCLPHVLQAAPTAALSTLKMLAERLLATLDGGDDACREELLAGLDDDAGRRACWRCLLPEGPTTGTTVKQLRGRLQIESCPVCLSTGLTERRYVHWLLERTLEDDQSLLTDPGELCAAHLHDVALADRSLAGPAIERKRRARMGRLRRLLDQLAELPASERRRRRGGVDDLDRARKEFTSAQYCPACHARNGTDGSQLELVRASLSLAPVREDYGRGHGLCVRHALQLTKGHAARLARRHLDGRLGVLAWEVHETARKYAWAFRHEPSGSEHDAWLRALAQVDGRVFEGGPAPAARPSAVSEQS